MKKMESMKKAVAYIRVSSKGQIDNTSLDNQLEKIKAYCVAYDLKLVKVFSDGAESGKSNKRTEYNKMLNYIEENEVDSLMVFKADRIHRQLKNLLILIEDILTPNKISFVSVSERFDTSTPQGKLFLHMIGSFAEFERNVINERTKDGRIKTVKAGKHGGGELPFGYVKINKKIEIDVKTSKIIELIFNLYLEKKSLAKVKKELDLQHIINKNDKPFSRQSLAFILHNETYIGVYEYDGKSENNNLASKKVYPKIITTQKFNKVQSILSR